MSIKSARQKGKDLEDHVADEIVRYGIDLKARRDGASGAGNREKGDITTSMMVLGQNAGFECKNHKTLSLPDWWRQTKKLENLGREPILAYKLPGDSYEGTLVTIYLDTFLRLVAQANASGAKPPEDEDLPMDPQEKRERRYAFDQLKSAINRASKWLD